MEKKTMSLYAFGLVVILVVCAKTVSGLSCTFAIVSLSPCQGFLIGTAPTPSVQCCLAVAQIAKKSVTREARQELCNCFEQSAPTFGVKPEKARELPNRCNVKIPFPIDDPSVDCGSIPF